MQQYRLFRQIQMFRIDAVNLWTPTAFQDPPFPVMPVDEQIAEWRAATGAYIVSATPSVSHWQPPGVPYLYVITCVGVVYMDPTPSSPKDENAVAEPPEPVEPGIDAEPEPAGPAPSLRTIWDRPPE